LFEEVHYVTLDILSMFLRNPTLPLSKIDRISQWKIPFRRRSQGFSVEACRSKKYRKHYAPVQASIVSSGCISVEYSV